MTKVTLLLFASAIAAALGACSNGADDLEDTDLQVATTDGEADALAKALPAGDFSQLALGAKIIGAHGPEVKGALSNQAGNLADIRSYVSCPESTDPCDPNTAPQGTVFTYVHVITPGEDHDSRTGSGDGPDNSTVERATAFSMTRPAIGFTGNAGYAKAEALAVLGKTGKVVITCDDGKIKWTLNSGDGGDQWRNKEPMTFYWQSTAPPAGPVEAYRIHANYVDADGTGPYPAIRESATNVCETKAPS